MPKVNAYSLFVYDVAKRRKAAGQGNCQVPSLFKELGPEWSSLPEDQKQKYKDRAKSSTSISSADQWTRSRVAPVEVASITGPDVKMEVESKPELKSILKKRPHDDSYSITDQDKKKLKPGIPNWKNIKNSTNIEDPIKYLDKDLYDLRDLCQSILKVRGDKVISIPIYSFSANVLCKQKKDDEEIFVPLEICICAYSIKDGYIGKPYHVMIDPGGVPTNCLNAALDHAANHKITFPPKPEGYPQGARKDYKKIYKEMLEYIKAGERTILISSPRERDQVRGILEWIYKKSIEEPGAKGLSPVSTWSIVPITDFVAYASTFDYNTAIMCDYHMKDENQTKWCAQSCAKKMLISLEAPILDQICKLYEMYRRSKEPVYQTFIGCPSLTQGPNGQQYQQQQPSLQATQATTEQEQPCLMNQQQEQPLLAIQATPTQDMDTSVNLDPRIRGRLQPTQIPISAINDGLRISADEEIQKKPNEPAREEPLIIASSGIIYEHPPDIF